MSKLHQLSAEKQIVTELKNEIADELGIPNYDKIDKGCLPSEVNGKIGGTLTRRMIHSFEHFMLEYPFLLKEILNPTGHEYATTSKNKVMIHNKYGPIIDELESHITD